MTGEGFTAVRSACGAWVAMRHGDWRRDIALSELPRWLAFYRGLRDRDGGRFAGFYAPQVEALERLAAEGAA